jgi:hypothetical protein
VFTVATIDVRLLSFLPLPLGGVCLAAKGAGSFKTGQRPRKSCFPKTSAESTNQPERLSYKFLFRLRTLGLTVDSQNRSEFSNFVDLELRESVARRFLPFDRNDLGGQFSKLGVHGLAGLTSQ